MIKIKNYLLILLFFTTVLDAQVRGVGINTEQPKATLHVNGTVRIRATKNIEKEYVDGSKDIETVYTPLYWDKGSHEIVTRELEHPYIKGSIEYVDEAPTPTDINLDPDKYDLFVTSISIKKSPKLPPADANKYRVVVSNVSGGMPIKTFEIKKDATAKKYTFKAFFEKHVNPAEVAPLSYYDGSEIQTPLAGQKPVWVADFIAIDKNYLSALFDVTVEYSTYWDCATCGGKYGIELGKYFNENPDATGTVTKDVTAQEKTDVE